MNISKRVKLVLIGIWVLLTLMWFNSGAQTSISSVSTPVTLVFTGILLAMGYFGLRRACQKRYWKINGERIPLFDRVGIALTTLSIILLWFVISGINFPGLAGDGYSKEAIHLASLGTIITGIVMAVKTINMFPVKNAVSAIMPDAPVKTSLISFSTLQPDSSENQSGRIIRRKFGESKPSEDKNW